MSTVLPSTAPWAGARYSSGVPSARVSTLPPLQRRAAATPLPGMCCGAVPFRAGGTPSLRASAPFSALAKSTSRAL